MIFFKRSLYIFLAVVLFSCTKSESAELQLLFVDNTIQLRDLLCIENQLYCVGGSLWESAIVLNVDPNVGTFNKTEFETNSYLAIDKHNEQVISVGLSNQAIQLENDLWNPIALELGPLKRGICIRDDRILVTGGRAFFEGFISVLDSELNALSYTEFPHQLNDVTYLGGEHYLAVGYGAIYHSSNGGITWQILDLEGDFFQSAYFSESLNSAFVVGQAGLTYWIKSESEILKIGDRKLGNKGYRDIIYFQGHLIRIGDKGMMEFTTLDQIEWNTIRLSTNSNLLGIEGFEDKLYIVSEAGELFSLTFNF